MSDDNLHNVEYLQSVVKEEGSVSAASKALGIPRTTLRRRLGMYEDPRRRPSDKIEDDIKGELRTLTSKGRIKSVDQLLATAEIDLNDWIIDRQVVNTWDAMARQEDGTTAPETMYQVKIWLTHKYIVDLEPIKLSFKGVREPLQGIPPEGTVLCLPDAQFGFRRTEDGTLEPFHSEEALQVSLKAAKEIAPDVVVLMGDMIDFPQLSRFQTEPNTRQLLQPSLDALGEYLQALVDTVGKATPIYWLEGNHELRLRNALLDLHAGALADIRPANESGPPQLSVERLLHLDELGITYVKPYGTPLWLWDVMLHHGYIVRGSGGKTVSSILGNTTHHHIVGHIHRREIASRSIETPEGRKEIHAMSPGCLASLERGGVPAGKGRPGVDWQHGLGVIYRHNNVSHLHCIPILDGVCVVNGKVIS
tara:strand:+ start:1098 stop:2360 length:1263 start_codon:yes stop_codon:yes gene_type:complete